jgi:teichuronic acid biosynthesis glycosyltransferase TuaC
MRVLILTKIFPNRAEPHSSPFNRQQFAALSKLCEVDLLATIPWFPGASAFGKWSRAGRLLDVPGVETIDGLTVHHPRFVFLPRFGRGIAGHLYAASLAKAAVVYDGKVDVVLGSWAYPDGFAAVVLAGLLGVPAVIKLHGSDMNVVATMDGPRRRIRWAFQRAARIIAVSRPLREAAIALGASGSVVDVVPNGVDRARFHPQDRAAARASLGIPEGGPVALYVGNVEEHKGAVDLMHAFGRVSADVPGARLMVVGDGAAMPSCRRLAVQTGANVVFAGARPHAEVPAWIGASDVLVLPSWNEGTPNVLLEALACGRRAVATSVGGVPDVLSNDVAGILVPPKNPEVLARAVARALSEPYDPASVLAALHVPDWNESAAMLCASLREALHDAAREAA